MTGAVVSLRRYDKKALTIEEQIDLLRRRGLEVPDEHKAKAYLQTIGYYRLSAYFKPFQVHDSGDIADHLFQKNCTFDDIQDLYVLDRHLRLLMMDALERIEVAVRTVISNTLCVRYKDPFWFMNRNLFEQWFLDNQRGYCELISNIENFTGKHKEDRRNEACRHFFETYDSPGLPPAWVVIETLTMGNWSKVYGGLKVNDKNRIARFFGIKKGDLKTWFHELTDYRNACAHHERFWNRTFKRKARNVERYTHSGVEINTPYAKYVIIYSMLKAINRKTKWPERLSVLLASWPLDIHEEMGFPKDWEKLPFWQVPSE